MSIQFEARGLYTKCKNQGANANFGGVHKAVLEWMPGSAICLHKPREYYKRYSMPVIIIATNQE
jgi:hypothetical protein